MNQFGRSPRRYSPGVNGLHAAGLKGRRVYARERIRQVIARVPKRVGHVRKLIGHFGNMARRGCGRASSRRCCHRVDRWLAPGWRAVWTNGPALGAATPGHQQAPGIAESAQ